MELQKLVQYDSETGLFKKTGADEWIAGAININGYLYIQINGVRHAAHRLAWAIAHGYWPKAVDHKNAIRIDNRLVNLREATNSQNQANRTVWPLKKNGLPRGVAKTHDGSGFETRIQVRGLQHHLGTYPTPLLAHMAYARAAMYFYGEFMRTE